MPIFKNASVAATGAILLETYIFQAAAGGRCGGGGLALAPALALAWLAQPRFWLRGPRPAGHGRCAGRRD